MKRKTTQNRARVICAMSGGVDSSVAAAILKNQGYEVIGIFMKLWADDKDKGERENICCSHEAASAARAVARKLNIPFYVVDFETEFKKRVVDYFISEHTAGRTPNPCVICNRDIKGEILWQKAKDLQADYLATGHYVRIVRECKMQNAECKIKEYYLYQAKDKVKDQSYFLWMMKKEDLDHLLFPIGDYTKTEVRALAKKLQLPTAERRESQGICFIPDRDIKAFLRGYTKKLQKPGHIMNTRGEILGRHRGLLGYTIGQRQHLGLGGPEAHFVVKLDEAQNQLIVGGNDDLLRKELRAGNSNWFGRVPKGQIYATIRYGHPAEKCIIHQETDGKIKVRFSKPQRAVTPGQSIVFYEGSRLAGGGIIQ